MSQTTMSELKKRAILAKQRMKMGYWQQMMKEREDFLSRVGKTDNNVRFVSEVQRAEISRDAANIITSNSGSLGHDEALYCKVKEILDENEYVSNPIGRLINKNEYDNLDEPAKQRYILELSKKYRELKERYYKERLGKATGN